jgi:hypothetical protein
MSKAIDEILNFILEEFAACRQATEELEAKALYRLLNYCPPPGENVPIATQEITPYNWVHPDEEK